MSFAEYASMAWMVLVAVGLWVIVIAVAAFAIIELTAGTEDGALDTL